MFKIIIKESTDLYSGLNDSDDILNKYALKLKKIGYDVQGRKYLGGGTMGDAFLLSSGKVLKVTEDSSEAKSSAIIAGKETTYLARIEKVFKFGTTGQFGIVMENLNNISKEEMAFWDELSDTHFLKDILTSPKPWKKVEPELKRRWIEEWDKKTVNQFLNNCKKYGFPQMLDELYKYGITFDDFHGENIMKRGKLSVVIDLGYSKQTKEPKIPVLEKAL